jgi:hypothetical protein
MSTKSTIAHGRGFRFYHEALDEDGVYLELEDVEFEAGYRRVMVKIPIDVWEVIRHTSPARLDLVDSSDEELRRTVERQVDERMAEYERARRGTLSRRRWSASSADSSSAGPKSHARNRSGRGSSTTLGSRSDSVRSSRG